MARSDPGRKAQLAAVAAVQRVWRLYLRLFELVKPREALVVRQREHPTPSERAEHIAFLMSKGDEVAEATRSFERAVREAASIVRCGLHGLGSLHSVARRDNLFPGESAARAAWVAASKLARDIRKSIGESRRRRDGQRRAERERHSIETRRERGRAYYARVRESETNDPAEANLYSIARAWNRHQRKLERSSARRVGFVGEFVTLLSNRFRSVEVGMLDSIGFELRWEEGQVCAARHTSDGNAPPPKQTAEARALAQLAMHPDWTDTRIAEAAGVSRRTLYKSSKYRAARQAARSALAIRSGGRSDRRRREGGEMRAMPRKGEAED